MFGCWFPFPCECGGPPYINIFRGNYFWKMTSKQGFTSSVWLSTHRMLGKLCYFKVEKASTESMFSGLYLAGTVLLQRCESYRFTQRTLLPETGQCVSLPLQGLVNTFLGHSWTTHEGEGCGSVSGSAGCHTVVTQTRRLFTGYGSVARSCKPPACFRTLKG